MSISRPWPRIDTSTQRRRVKTPVTGSLTCASWSFVPAVVVLSYCFCLSAAAVGDRIVLRDLTVISDVTVKSFTPDGAALESGRTISWDRIQSAKLAARQQQFDDLLKKLGGPLFRLRARLERADYAGLREPAESLFPVYSQRDGATAYLVFQSLMWARLQAGERAAAVAPCLLAGNQLRRDQALADRLPGNRRPAVDVESGVWSELLPIWFDAEAAKASLPSAFQAARTADQPWPDGVYLYTATLCFAAGEDEKGEQILSRLPAKSTVGRDLRRVLGVQRSADARSADALAAENAKLSPLARPLARYVAGQQQLASADSTRQLEGLLQLMKLPALHGEAQPHLAAAALHHVMKHYQQHDRPAAARSVRVELLSRYGQTMFAAKVREGQETDDEK